MEFGTRFADIITNFITDLLTVISEFIVSIFSGIIDGLNGGD